MKRLLAGIGVATAVGTILMGSRARPAGGIAVPRPLARVQFSAPGRIVGRTETAYVSAGATGVVARVLVDEGQAVEAGQALAEIACPDLAAALRRAEADFERATAMQRRVLRGSRTEERDAARAEELAAEARAVEADARHRRNQSLFEEGVGSRAMRDETERDLQASRAGHVAATRKRELVDSDPLPEEIDRADAETRAASAAAAEIRGRLAKCTVRSPFRGTVLKRLCEPGTAVSELVPQPLFTMSDLTAVRVRAEVDERDVSRVREGQEVEIRADAIGTRVGHGIVRRIGPSMGRKAIRTGEIAEKTDRDVLPVFIETIGSEVPAVVDLRVTALFLKGQSDRKSRP